MKKALSLLLLLILCFSLTACGRPIVAKELSCEEIIAAYEEAGYNTFHNHDDPFYYDLNEYCYIKITDPNDPENNYLYITRYFTVEDAKAAGEEKKFHPILWLFFGIFGEWRWLHTGYYGDFTYETFDYKMLKPLQSLMR